jgi:Transposase DDE domain group 1
LTTTVRDALKLGRPGRRNGSYNRTKKRYSYPRALTNSLVDHISRLQLHLLAYNLGNFMRTVAMPKVAEPSSLTGSRKKLIKIGAKVVSHGRYTTFQMAEVAVSRQSFQEILMLIGRLRAPPAPA